MLVGWHARPTRDLELALTIAKKRRTLKILHSYFGYPEVPARCDIVKLHQVSAPPLERGWKCREFYTLHLELKQSTDQLLSQLKGPTRYEIVRARDRDRLVTQIADEPTGDGVMRFVEFYNSYTQFHTISTDNSRYLVQLASLKSLSISSASNEFDGDLAFHAYLVDEQRARLLLSVIRQPQNNCGGALLGRANRLLHWQDICHFKNKGLTCYDFGGLYIKGDDLKLLQVARFKAGFGGKLVKEYKCIKALTVRGKLALGLQQGIDGFGALTKRIRTRVALSEFITAKGSDGDITRSNSCPQ